MSGSVLPDFLQPPYVKLWHVQCGDMSLESSHPNPTWPLEFQFKVKYGNFEFQGSAHKGTSCITLWIIYGWWSWELGFSFLLFVFLFVFTGVRGTIVWTHWDVDDGNCSSFSIEPWKGKIDPTVILYKFYFNVCVREAVFSFVLGRELTVRQNHREGEVLWLMLMWSCQGVKIKHDLALIGEPCLWFLFFKEKINIQAHSNTHLWLNKWFIYDIKNIFCKRKSKHL